MNSSLLASSVLVSKESLSDSLTDYVNVYVLPTICIFGMTTNSANIIVTWRLKMSDHVLQYMLINSILDFLFLLTQVFVFVVRCGTLCSWDYTYLAELYDLFVYMFLCYIFITFQALFNLQMTMQRLLLFSNISSPPNGSGKKKTLFLMAVFLALAIILNAPSFLFSRYVKNIGVSDVDLNQTIFKLVVKDEYKSGFLMWLLIGFILIKTPLLYVLTGVVNMMVALRFRNFMKKKHQLTNLKARAQSKLR
jgi:hypothetical protein